MNNSSLYLSTLSLKNFATFENQEITFDQSMNAIIGETGSGKSLILEALQLILGQRADKGVVRKNTEFSVVEGTFHCADKKILKNLEILGYPSESNEIQVKRMIYENGTSKSFLNGSACNLSTLVAFTRQFVDVVGQFENQKLLDIQYQLNLLDTYAQLQTELAQYDEIYDELQKLKQEWQKWQENLSHREQRLDFLKFQVEEIESLNPSQEDEDSLNSQKKNIQNKDKKIDLVNRLNSFLSENEIKKAITEVEKNSELFSPDLSEKLSLFSSTLDEVSYLLDKELGENEEELDLDAIMSKLDLYQKLKRKFGGSIEALLETFSQYKEELKNLENFETSSKELERKLKNLEQQAENKAKDLHSKREIFAKKLSQELTKKIRELRMPGATVKISVSQMSELCPSGFTQLNFEGEINPGEGYHSIKNIASGGELSRILLAIRQVVSAKDSLSIFLFDEIDTGMGGETALCIGKALAEVATSSQVIAITHLPQIAHCADKLIVVSKETGKKNKEQRTYSLIREVTGKSKEQEVRAMVPLQ